MGEEVYLGSPKEIMEVKEMRSRGELDAEVYPNISRIDERRRQGLILASYYADHLGRVGTPANIEDYIASLPEIPEEQSNSTGLVPVIVENRVPWKEAVELSGIHVSPYIDVSRVRKWDKTNFDEPETPYVIWVSRYTTVDRSLCTPRELRARYYQESKGEENVAAGSLLAVISFCNVRRDLMASHRWVVIGAEVDDNRIFVLSSFNSKPWLEVVHLDFKRQPCDVEFHHKRVVGS